LAIMDDASWYIVAYGVYPDLPTENTLTRTDNKTKSYGNLSENTVLNPNRVLFHLLDDALHCADHGTLVDS
jgi:hypothetical protein